MIQLCEENKLINVVRSPLEYGLLTGKYTEKYELSKEHWLKGVNLTDGYFAKMKKFANLFKNKLTEDGRTLAQAALGYIWALTETVIPIPGAKNINQFAEKL